MSRACCALATASTNRDRFPTALLQEFTRESQHRGSARLLSCESWESSGRAAQATFQRIGAALIQQYKSSTDALFSGQCGLSSPVDNQQLARSIGHFLIVVRIHAGEPSLHRIDNIVLLLSPLKRLDSALVFSSGCGSNPRWVKSRGRHALSPRQVRIRVPTPRAGVRLVYRRSPASRLRSANRCWPAGTGRADHSGLTFSASNQQLMLGAPNACVESTTKRARRLAKRRHSNAEHKFAFTAL